MELAQLFAHLFSSSCAEVAKTSGAAEPEWHSWHPGPVQNLDPTQDVPQDTMASPHTPAPHWSIGHRSWAGNEAPSNPSEPMWATWGPSMARFVPSSSTLQAFSPTASLLQTQSRNMALEHLRVTNGIACPQLPTRPAPSHTATHPQHPNGEEAPSLPFPSIPPTLFIHTEAWIPFPFSPCWPGPLLPSGRPHVSCQALSSTNPS